MSTDREWFPWVLLDPEWPAWNEASELERAALAQLISGGVSVLMGGDDYRRLEEAARGGTDLSVRQLREGLRRGAKLIRGSSMTSPREVLGYDQPDGPHPEPRLAFLGDDFEEAWVLLESLGCERVGQLGHFLLSEKARTLLTDRMRNYPPGTPLAQVWNEVLGPFCRADRINVYETYVFRPLVEGHDVRSTGLYWFLDRIRQLATKTSASKIVVVRGTYRDRGGPSSNVRQKSVERELLDVLDGLAEEFSPSFDVTFDVIDSAAGPRHLRVAHDRFWLAGNDKSTTRLLVPSNSIVQLAGRSVNGGAPSLRDTVTVSFSDAQADIGPRESDWSRLGSARVRRSSARSA